MVEKMKEVAIFLDSIVQSDVYWVVAVSGGPDSMALLSFLEEYKQRYLTLHLVCALVNHNTGRIGQKEEQDFLRTYCMEHQIIYETITLPKIDKKNFHREAHRMRYSFFEQLIHKYHASYLFTAHHADDLIETILMRITRGSTLKGYHGFSRLRDMNGYKIVRPFIHLYKKELLEYVTLHDIPYFVDSSNEKDVYTRNRFRKYIVPAIKNECSDAASKFYQFSAQVSVYYDYVENQAYQIYKSIYHFPVLDISLFADYPDLIQRHILMHVLSDIYQENLYQIYDEHIRLLQKCIFSSKGNTCIMLPGLQVTKVYQKLYFASSGSFILEKRELKEKNVFPEGVISIVSWEDKDGNDVCRLSSETVKFPLFIRGRNKGDRVYIKGMQGSKKLKDIFIDEKIPKDKRDGYPLVVDSDNRIVWIPNLKKTKFDKTKGEKYDIILKYQEGGKK